MAELHNAALEGDWIAAEKRFEEAAYWIRTPITEGGEIAPNIAADERRDIFISKFLEIMEKDDVAAQNAKG